LRLCTETYFCLIEYLLNATKTPKLYILICGRKGKHICVAVRLKWSHLRHGWVRGRAKGSVSGGYACMKMQGRARGEVRAVGGRWTPHFRRILRRAWARRYELLNLENNVRKLWTSFFKSCYHNLFLSNCFSVPL